MSAPEATKPVDVPAPAPEHVEPAPVPVLASEISTAPVVAPATTEDPIKPVADTEAIAPVDEKKDEKKDEVKDAKAEEKVVEPIYNGALGYKAPGLKNAFRFSKRYFWFGEEPVASSNLREYLRGEKPEVAHPVVAWSSQTGKGLLFFVKHADQKENPAGALSLAYATDLAKDGLQVFTFKISGSKHAFEAMNGAERDGWFVAVEKAIADAKEAKDGIESSEGYKEHKDKISKPTAAVVAAATAPKKSTDVAPKLAEGETAAEPSAAAPARTGSSSSSSAGEDKKKKKSKSRSLSRGKRQSIFGGLLGKKDKEHKEGEAAKATEAEAKKDEPPALAPAGEPSATAPVITTDIPQPSEELKAEGIDAPLAEPAPVVAAAAPVEEAKKEETPAKTVEEKPKPAKRGSIFGSFVEKLKSPREEKKEVDFPTTSPAIKEAEVAPEASKPAEEAKAVEPVAAAADVPAVEPLVTEPTAEPTAAKVDETKPAATGTPSKEKEHFSFGKFFGSKERAKSPAAAPKTEEKAAEAKTDVAPKIEDAPATTPAAPEVTPIEPTTEAAAPTVETKAESKAETKADEVKKDETPTTPKKRGSIFGSLTRSLSKATGKKDKDAVKPAEKKDKLPETAEEAKTDAPVVADKPAEEAAATTATDAAPADAPVEKTIGDVPAEAVTVGEPKSAPAVAST